MSTATYSTPGVYIQEIDSFPPSIAAVPTAIPAFIGYTETATYQGENLLNVPTKISSLVQFSTIFGGPFVPVAFSVTTDQNNGFAVLSVTIDGGNRFYMYDSIREFYDNGGGDCYIVCVGLFPATGAPTGTTITLGDVTNPATKPGFLTGLAALERTDEPTILLFPDAVSLGSGTSDSADFYSLQQAALLQCADLQSRVAVLDLYEAQTLTNPSFDPVQDFRNYIGMNDLNYGMAYTPWIYASYYTKNDVDFSQFSGSVFLADGTTKATLTGLTSDAPTNALVTNVVNALADQTAATNTINNFLTTKPPGGTGPGYTTTDAVFQFLSNAAYAKNDPADLLNLISFLRQLALAVENAWNNATYFKNPLLTNTVNSYATSSSMWKGGIAALMGIELNTSVLTPEGETAATALANYTGKFTNNNWIGATLPGASGTPYTSDAMIIIDLTAAYNKLSGFINAVISAAGNYVTTSQAALYSNHPVISNIVSKIAKELNRMPPSGAVTGVYAFVDNSYGVWNAPANVSLNSVTGPVKAISADDQSTLNVDVLAGKSINAIRAFVGQGTLIWGARTLAGNDDNWRYISVRRFLIMVEQSTKLACNTFVFKPNDASTWGKVQAMIENFLTIQWRAGALLGAKATDAFYVAVGLNKTMSAQDLLDGNLIVEIGMAVVRPAEFIILRFTQIMAQSS